MSRVKVIATIDPGAQTQEAIRAAAPVEDGG